MPNAPTFFLGRKSDFDVRKPQATEPWLTLDEAGNGSLAGRSGNRELGTQLRNWTGADSSAAMRWTGNCARIRLILSARPAGCSWRDPPWDPGIHVGPGVQIGVRRAEGGTDNRDRRGAQSKPNAARISAARFVTTRKLRRSCASGRMSTNRPSGITSQLWSPFGSCAYGPDTRSVGAPSCSSSSSPLVLSNRRRPF